MLKQFNLKNLETRNKLQEKLKPYFYKFTDFNFVQGVGAGWISQFQNYLPIGRWLKTSSELQIAVWGLNAWLEHQFHFQLNVSFPLIFGAVAVKDYMEMVESYLWGKFAIWIGIYQAQQQYVTKTAQLNPYNVEYLKTLKNICDATGAKYEMTDL